MRRSRKDLVPVLAIVAGGLIGASISFNFLGRSPGLLYEYSVTVESATRVAARVGTVNGQVTDAQTGASVAAAQVYIANLYLLGALSQQNGRYLLQNVPAGTHTLSVFRIGYRTTEVQITVGGGRTLDQDFSVAEGPLQVKTVIRQRKDGRFVEAMEERESVTSPTESLQPVEVGDQNRVGEVAPRGHRV